MYSILSQNNFDYNSISTDGFITNNGSLSNGIIVDNVTCNKVKINDAIQIEDLNNNDYVIHTNTTNHDQIIYINCVIQYNIINTRVMNYIKIHDKCIYLNPLDNTVTYTNLIKLGPNESIRYLQYGIKVLNITGDITCYSFENIVD